MENIYRAALRMISGMTNTRTKNFIAFFGSARLAWLATRRDLFFCGLLDETSCNKFFAEREKIDIQKIAEQWARGGICVCSTEDADYPELLRRIFDPPEILFYRGRLPDSEKLVAIVGARRASAYGKNAATAIAGELARSGVGVVSGGARGIDAAAHDGALSQGYTVAVLGCGVDVIYPRENAKLLAAIAENGAVVSEYPPGMPPLAHHFPARNRIISGMCRGVVVVEAAEKSGSLITADCALDEGRDVYAVPGSIFSAASKGSNRLIKQGAKLIDSADDILEDYGFTPVAGSEKISLTVDEQKVFSQLNFDSPLCIEELVLKTDLSAQFLTYILLQLELRGLVAEYGRQRYIRRPGREIG